MGGAESGGRGRVWVSRWEVGGSVKRDGFWSVMAIHVGVAARLFSSQMRFELPRPPRFRQTGRAEAGRCRMGVVWWREVKLLPALGGGVAGCGIGC